jgi:hypothetical protein
VSALDDGVLVELIGADEIGMEGADEVVSGSGHVGHARSPA